MNKPAKLKRCISQVHFQEIHFGKINFAKIDFAKIEFGNQNLKAVGHRSQKAYISWSTEAL